MLASEVAVLKSRHSISLKCSRYRDTGPTDPSLLTKGYSGAFSMMNELSTKQLRVQGFSIAKFPHKCWNTNKESTTKTSTTCDPVEWNPLK